MKYSTSDQDADGHQEDLPPRRRTRRGVVRVRRHAGGAAMDR